MSTSEGRDLTLQTEQVLTVKNLVTRAVCGLPQMFDSRSGLFCYKVKKTADSLVQEAVSHRYTVMTLLGLHRLEQSGTRSPIELKPILERLLADIRWADNVGDFGLLLWLVCIVAPERLDELDSRISIANCSKTRLETDQGITMRLAWFLTGISYYAQVSGRPEKVKDIASETYKRLTANQGKGGYFSHQAMRGIKGSLRGWMGSFADQVYPIYGMTQFAQVFGDKTALQRATECAIAICEAQGPLGQWWWHYDSRKGSVFEEYPVFSVHQHGMAPMTLLALSRATGTNFDRWIYKGLEWIDRKNELAVNMEDVSANVIWRCIRRSPLRRVSDALLHSGANHGNSRPNGLKVLFECRPYELGWLLYGLVDLLPDSPGAKQEPRASRVV